MTAATNGSRKLDTAEIRAALRSTTAGKRGEGLELAFDDQSYQNMR